MSRETNLRQHALDLLEQAKKFLLEDGDLDPTAFVITGKGQLLRPIELQDEVSKAKSCKRILTEARKLHAFAIVTIFLARSKEFEREEFTKEAYSWGDIQQQNSERCILVTLSGPGVRNWAVAVPFDQQDKKIIFGRQVEFTAGVDIGLFPGWSDQITAPRVS